MRFGVGLSIPELTTRGGGGSAAFRQTGPTLDLCFIPVVTSGEVQQNYSLNLDFIGRQYQVGQQYMVWT